MRERFEAARESGRPLLGGHRGNPAELPENTLASFRSALELGVDLVECDVHLSSDGRLVVIHDHTVDRTTNGRGPVRDLTGAELAALDAGGGERVPFLEEVLDLAAGRAHVAVELKQAPLPYPGLEEALLGLLREAEMVGQCAVISFSHPSAKLVKELEPGLVTGILDVGRPVDPVAMLEAAGADIFASHWTGCDPAMAEAIHDAGRSVALWVVDEPFSAAWTRACGPDAVFTNRPREIAPLLS